MTQDFNENQSEQKSLFEDTELQNLLNHDGSEDSVRIRRSMKKSQYDRVVRQKSILIIRLRSLLRILLVVGIIYFTYRLMTATRWYLPKDAITSSKIQRIQIVGNKITPTYKILSVINSIELPNKPIYMIKTDEFVQKISGLPPVKRVYAKRLWNPARIVIFVEEKEPALSVANSLDTTPIAFFTSEGTIVGQEYLPLPDYYKPYLLIVKNNDKSYMNWDKNDVYTISSLARAIEKLSGEEIEYFDMQNPEDIYVKLKSTNVRLGEIDSKTFNRIKDIKSILAEAHSLENKVPVKYIDLSWDESKFIKLGEENTDAEDSNSAD